MSPARFLLLTLLPATLCPAAPGPGAAGTFGNKRAIVFGIDGCRSDALKLAVKNGTAPNIAGLIAHGATTWNAYAGGVPGTPTQQNTNSGPGWASVLTGVWTDKHGVTSNSFAGRNFGAYPHFFKRLHTSQPDTALSSLVSWPEINTFIVEDSGGSTICNCHTYTTGSYDQRDAELTAKTVEIISTSHPDVLFCYLGNVDITGHSLGFSPDVPAYMSSIATADSRIGQVLAAVRARPSFSQEDWLYVVTTDHGGTGTGHGGQSDAERIIPFIASGGQVPQGEITRELLGQVAVPATVYRHLGLGIPAAWGWESDAFRIGANLRAAAGARSVFLAWSLPAVAPAGLSGFVLRRNGTVIATLDAQPRQFTDSIPGLPGQALAYSLTLTGTDEGALTTSSVAPGAAATVSPPSLHLTFDGDLQDSSGRSNHATAEGTAVFVAGKNGQALQLGSTSSARIGTTAAGAPADLRFGADTDFTLSFWFKANAGWSSDPGIISNKNWNSGANQGWIVAGENNGNDWQWNLKGSLLTRRDFDPSAANISGTAWRLITVTHDRDGEAVFYHDGTEIGRSVIAGAGDVDTAFPVRIGRDGNNAFPWATPAFIDDLKVWRRVLTPDEVAAEAQTSGLGQFNAWMADQADLYEYTGTDFAGGGDPDKDGNPNLLEYAAGTSPFRAAETPLISMETSGPNRRVRFSQRNGGLGIHGTDATYTAAGLTYQLEFSRDLSGGWQPVTGVATQLDAESTVGRAGTGTHEVLVQLPAWLPRGFCRVRVDLP
jgi:hypothetical protein